MLECLQLFVRQVGFTDVKVIWTFLQIDKIAVISKTLPASFVAANSLYASVPLGLASA